jgi:hypothetical protein
VCIESASVIVSRKKKNMIAVMFTVQTLFCFIAKLGGHDSNHDVLIGSNLGQRRLFGVFSLTMFYSACSRIKWITKQQPG